MLTLKSNWNCSIAIADRLEKSVSVRGCEDFDGRMFGKPSHRLTQLPCHINDAVFLVVITEEVWRVLGRA